MWLTVEKQGAAAVQGGGQWQSCVSVTPPAGQPPHVSATYLPSRVPSPEGVHSFKKFENPCRMQTR